MDRHICRPLIEGQVRPPDQDDREGDSGGRVAARRPPEQSHATLEALHAKVPAHKKLVANNCAAYVISTSPATAALSSASAKPDLARDRRLELGCR